MMIAFATAEDALASLCRNLILHEEPACAAYYDAARDCILSDLTALRAENARLRAVVDAADDMAFCEADSKSLAAYHLVRAALDAKEEE